MVSNGINRCGVLLLGVRQALHLHAGGLAKHLKLAIAALLLLPISAFAGVDWTVQLSDTGYDPVAAGGNIVYVATVANNGLTPASATTITFAIPATATYTGATGMVCSPAAPLVGPASLICTVPALSAAGNAGDSVSVSVTVQSSVSTALTVTATVPTAGDDDTNNNVATQGTTVNAGADIALALTGPSTAQSGKPAK